MANKGSRSYMPAGAPKLCNTPGVTCKPIVMSYRTISMTDAASPEAERSRSADPINHEIRAIMARRRVLQADLAKALGVAQPGISERLTGRQDWRLGELRIVSGLLRIPLPRLIEACDAHAEPAAQPA